MALIAKLRSAAAHLKREIVVLYLAMHHPRTPRYAKAFIACIVAYALSPIDLIPDFIPILGYLDDLILIPLGISLALRIIPQAVIAECRQEASLAPPRLRRSRAAAVFIVLLWVAALLLTLAWIREQ
jgi:uncharacterized membrane protein YkvA (DUF1232 family)